MSSCIDSSEYSHRSLRIASVPYCNTLPLIRYLPEVLPDPILTTALPSALRKQFEEETVDLALMPVAELPFLPQCRIVSNCCIGCRGSVRSVLLYSKVPIEKIQTVAFDAASRSSNTLCEVILRHFYRITPIRAAGFNPPDADAFVIIGDRALAYHPSADWHYCYDMGALWLEHTGLPMVFAAWIGTAAAEHPEVVSALETSRDRGLQNLESVLDGQDSLPQSRSDILDYYRRAIVYTMEDAERAGLQLFFNLAAQYGILPAAVRSY